jgi:hypothetical protein
MRAALIPTILSSCSAATAASSSPYLFSNPLADEAASLRIPTSYESAVQGRRILALTPIGTLATIFADDSNNSTVDAAENRPAGLGGMPHGLMDYIADCTGSGDPTLLALNIETHFRNVRAGSNISLAVRWTPPYPPAKRIKSASSHLQSLLGYLGWSSQGDRSEADYDPLPYSAANLPRFSLLGYIAPIPGSDDHSDPESVGGKLAACFTAAHPDARYWLPGNRIHESHFVTLVVTHVYWIGGFGDRAFIGWIPVEEWRNVTREEWQDVRLPGEKKGWKEWAVEGMGAGEL